MFTTFLVSSLCLLVSSARLPLRSVNDVIIVSPSIDQMGTDDQCDSRQFTNDNIAQDYKELSMAISYAKNVLAEITREWQMFQELEKNTNDLEKLNVIKVPDWLPDITEKTNEAITLRKALMNANQYFQKTKIILNHGASHPSFSTEIRGHFQSLTLENDRILYKVRDTMCLEYGTVDTLSQENRPVVPPVETQSERDYMTFLILHNYKEATIFLDILFKKLSR